MKKLIFFLIVLPFLFMGLSAEETTLLRVKSAVANVRAQPEGSSQMIIQLKQGEEIESRAKKGNWFEVTVADAEGKTVTGYIHMSTVEVVEAAARVEPEERAEPERRMVTSSREIRSSSGFKIAVIPVMSNMKFSQTFPTGTTKKAAFGFGGGIGYDMNLGGSFNLEIDVMFAPGGCNIKLNDEWVIHGYALTMPVLLKVRLGSGSAPTLFAGGEGGYVLTTKYKVLTDTGGTVEWDATDILNRFYYGLVFGLGYEMQMSSMTLVLEGRYHMGLSNLAKEPATYTIKTTAFVLLVGIKI